MNNMEHEKHNKSNHHEMMVQDFKKRFFISLLLTLPVLFLSPLVQSFFDFTFTFSGDKYLLFVLSTAVFFYGGWPFLKGASKELKNKLPGMMTLIAVAISVAFAYSSAVVFGLKGKFFFWELVTLIDVMLLGHWIEMRSVMGASKALEGLARLMPAIAHKVNKQGQIVDIAVSELMVSDVILVKPGEKIPSDGVIVEGTSNVNEAMLTGESMPVIKKLDDEVIGGSLNGEGVIKIKISRTGEDSYLSQVIKLVKEAQASKSETQDLANRAALWLTIIAILTGIITLSVWLLLGKDLSFSLERMVTVMVIACPHALGLAVPLVVATSTSLSAKNGLLIRDRVAFERAKEIDVVVFDKTGTLTKGEFGITDVIAENDYEQDMVLSYAASLESNSQHPIARGITKEAAKRNIPIESVTKFISLPGKGIEGFIGDKLIRAVGQNYLKDKGIKIENEKIAHLKTQGKTLVYILYEEEIMGVIGLADLIKEESKITIDKLKSMGIKTMMLTGDNKQVAQWVAAELGLDDFFAEVLPHEKSGVIKDIQAQQYKVAMVGDGVNDAPALAQADVGIAIGAGTDVAIESADIVLVRSNPQDVISIIHLAKATYNKMKQNLIWATGYNIIAIPLAAGVLYNFGILLNPALGAMLMSLSTVIVAINARFLSISKY